MDNCECCVRHKENQRSEKEIKALKNRINRISGQLNGINLMIDDNRYCGDILVQLSASIQGLKQVAYMILKSHMETCVASDLKNEKFESLDEMISLIEKLR